MSADWGDVFPSEPISGDTRATVELVGNDWRADDDWRKFKNACRVVAALAAGTVDPNEVRDFLTDEHGDLTIEPRRYSAFWSRAASKNGFLYASSWGVNRDTKGRNAGKPTKIYALRDTA